MFDQDTADGAAIHAALHSHPEQSPSSRAVIAPLSSPSAVAPVFPTTRTQVLERLPFTVRLVRNDVELRKAVQIRHAAYARHLPTFAQTLLKPEEHDAERGTVVLLAESKLDGSALGTMRIQTNLFKPLGLEQSVTLPAWLKAQPLAEATRLGVTEERIGRLVKSVLFKAFYLYCQRNGIEWMVVTGRFPLDRMYERLLFDEVYPGMGFVPLSHVGNLPHRIMSLEVAKVEPRWGAAKHPLYEFFFHTTHEDIDVGPSRNTTRPAEPEKVQIFPSVSTNIAVKNW